ncbi:hypothetical protein Hdeb2414_s0016g00470321 [Helianthus debilis subsp. tardiflorus]
MHHAICPLFFAHKQLIRERLIRFHNFEIVFLSILIPITNPNLSRFHHQSLCWFSFIVFFKP